MERDRADFPRLAEWIISTHTLTWSVTYRYFQGFPSLPYFNSHAHVERDFNSRSNSLVLHISTHTLTWSVTTGKRRRISITGISTHTLTWSVTGLPYSENAGKHISTHTLTWSVTQGDLKLFTYGEFQLTRSRGA